MSEYARRAVLARVLLAASAILRELLLQSVLASISFGLAVPPSRPRSTRRDIGTRTRRRYTRTCIAPLLLSATSSSCAASASRRPPTDAPCSARSASQDQTAQTRRRRGWPLGDRRHTAEAHRTKCTTRPPCIRNNTVQFISRGCAIQERSRSRFINSQSRRLQWLGCHMHIVAVHTSTSRVFMLNLSN